MWDDGPEIEIQAQSLIECFPVPLEEPLGITCALAAAQDPQQQQREKPLRITPAAVAGIGNGLKEAVQVIGVAQIGCNRGGLGDQERRHQLTSPMVTGPSRATGADF